MSVFRYACRDNAIVFLGLSESASDDMFVPVDKKHRLFGMRQREDGSRPALPEILSPPSIRARHGRDPRVAPSSAAAEIHPAVRHARFGPDRSVSRLKQMGLRARAPCRGQKQYGRGDNRLDRCEAHNDDPSV